MKGKVMRWICLLLAGLFLYAPSAVAQSNQDALRRAEDQRRLEEQQRARAIEQQRLKDQQRALDIEKKLKEQQAHELRIEHQRQEAEARKLDAARYLVKHQNEILEQARKRKRQ